MASIVLNKTVSLNAPITVESLHGVTFTKEEHGHKFIIACTKNGEMLTLTGTVTARFLRADNTTILIAGNDLTDIVDGKAVLTLPKDCYDVPGRFQMAVFLTEGSTSTCIYACVGSVQRSEEGTLIDSGEAVPSLDQLLAKIADCEQATVDARAAASDLKNRMLITPEVYITKNAYIQNGTRTAYNRTLKITDGFIELQVSSSYNRGFIINKKPADTTGDFKGVDVNLSNYNPALDDLSEINILRGCNALRFYAEQTTTASNPVSFMQLLFYNVSDDIITQVGNVSFTPVINGYNIKYFTIPDEATHYVLMAYQIANNPTNTKAAIQFTREDTSAVALDLSE